MTPALTQCLQQLVGASIDMGAQAHCRSEFRRLLEGTPELATRPMADAFLMLGTAPMPGTGHSKAFMDHLRTATRDLLDAGADPIPGFPDLIEGTNAFWFQGLLEDMIALDPEGRCFISPAGETPLHRLAEVGHTPIFLSKLTFPTGWTTQGRHVDGATPLHLAWDVQAGGAAKVMAFANGRASERWMAMEAMAELIDLTRAIARTASTWEVRDHAGIPAYARMLEAYRAGIGEWIPNRFGMDWMPPVQAYWEHRVREQALSCTLPGAHPGREHPRF